MQRAIGIGLMLLVAGCTDQWAARQAALSHLIGQPETVLIQQMGVPTRTFDTSGVRFLAYDEHRIDVVPAIPAYNPFYPGLYGGGFPPQVVDLRCETTFEVAGGIVRSFALHGNACG